jgi:hypothetical protein
METRCRRKMVAMQWADGILPKVIADLNLISNNITVVQIVACDADVAEVPVLDDWGNHRRDTIDS